MIGNTSYTTRKQKPNNDNKSSLKPSSNYKDYPKETWNKDLYYIRMESIIKGTTQFQNNIKIDKEFNLRYTLSDFIGSGVYGNVYSGFDKLTHTQIAVKFVDVHDKSFKREIVCLTQLKNSQFIIKYLFN